MCFASNKIIIIPWSRGSSCESPCKLIRSLLIVSCFSRTAVYRALKKEKKLAGICCFDCMQLGKAEVLRGLRNFVLTDSSEHQSIDRLEVRGSEKAAVAVSLSQVGTICVQPDQPWFCFEGLLLDTTARLDGAHMGLSEHYDGF